MYRKKLTEDSVKLVEAVFKETAIFTIDEFPLSAASHDVGTGYYNSENILRGRWLFDKHGFIEDLSSYNSFLRRLNEYFYYGDYLHTLRQRLNIIHLMMECNFDTNTPVHISIAPHDRDLKQKLVLDLHDKSTLLPFSIIAHPGQTRFQASVFAQHKLKNTLIYINKKFLKYIDQQTKGLKEIKTIEQLLEHHKPVEPWKDEFKDHLSHYEYNFNMGSPAGPSSLPAKYHSYNETYVLKASSVKGKTLPSFPMPVKKDWDSHPSLNYMAKTFLHTDRYFRILFNNKFNVYTTKNSEVLSKNQKNLYNSVTSYVHTAQDYSEFKYTKGLVHFKELDHNNFNTQEDWNRTVLHILGKNTLSDKERSTIDIFHQLIKDNKPAKTELKFNYIESEWADPLYYVKKNDYKGVCIVMHTEKIERVFEELLFFCSPLVSLARSSDSSVCVINCEHEYWKTKENYKEYVFTDKFIGNEDRVFN